MFKRLRLKVREDICMQLLLSDATNPKHIYYNSFLIRPHPYSLTDTLTEGSPHQIKS